MLWEKLRAPWSWLFEQLGNPGISNTLLILMFATVLSFFLLSRLVRWLMDHQLAEATSHLLKSYDRAYRAKGIPHVALKLIATCIAWIFVLKLVAELIEPFVLAFVVPEMAARVLGIARYDWSVLGALVVVIASYWVNFHWRVRKHDATKSGSKINRSPWRTLPLFCRPTIILLLLMFLPDLCRFSATVAASQFKATEVKLAVPTLPDFAHGMRATLMPVPNDHLASERP